jgi:SHS2 domain-containing protein
MFEILEHTADIGFRATAESLPELLETAADALAAIALDTSRVAERETYPVAAEGDALDSLLVNWLNEILYLVDGRRIAPRRFRVLEVASGRVRAEAAGEPRDNQRHEPKLVVKGVTYHQLRIEQGADGWICEVFLDI